jgi:hypothetical protein
LLPPQDGWGSGPDKTDWADARVIADLVGVGYMPKVWLATAPGLGSEGRWVVHRPIDELRALDRSIAEVERRLSPAPIRLARILR